jgi:beta-N-acetylhexosaminidase
VSGSAPPWLAVDTRRAAGRRLWIGIPGPTLDDATKALLERVRPGGIVLFRRNIESLAGVAKLVTDLRARLGLGLHVAVDQEHGLVVRFDRELTVFPGAMALGATGVREPSLAEHLAEDAARAASAEIAALGIDVNLAPVCDLAMRADNPGLGVRSFGAYPALTAKLVAAWTRGARAAGVASTLKHFPGLGGAAADSHLELPEARVSSLDDQLAPFASGFAAGAAIAMTTHCVFPDLDPGVPATFSRAIAQGLLRERLGFRGVSMTDDLEMGALKGRFPLDETVRRAAATHDVLCLCADPEAQIRAHEILSAEPPEAHVEASERLDALMETTRAVRSAPPRGERREDGGAAARLADAIAGRAVAVVRDPAGLLPLTKGGRLLALLPSLEGVTPVEDPLRGESLAVLREGFAAAGATVEEIPRRPDGADVERLTARAAEFPRCVLGTTNARFSEAEAAVVRAVVAAHRGAIVVALRNPFDLQVVPRESKAACVASFGFRASHQRALSSVLFGLVAPYGRPPVEL